MLPMTADTRDDLMTFVCDSGLLSLSLTGLVIALVGYLFLSGCLVGCTSSNSGDEPDDILATIAPPPPG